MRKLVFLAAVTLIFGLTIPAGADGGTDLIKWSQLPEMGPYGYDFSSETNVPSMAADDFLCSDVYAVTDIHWWGSYYRPGLLWPYPNSDNLPDGSGGGAAPQPPGVITGFNIEFYKDVPAGVDPYMPWSHPGQLVYETFVDMTLVSEAYYGTLTHIGGVEENVWQYNVVLPDPFFQIPWSDPQDIDGDGVDDGTVYWLKIQAVNPNADGIQWGWHEADSLWHDNAVQWWVTNPPEMPWNLLPNKDMAFELSFDRDIYYPEPSLFLIVGAGVLAIVRRRR